MDQLKDIATTQAYSRILIFLMIYLVVYNTRGEVLCLHGDPAYPLRPTLMGPYRPGDVCVLTPDVQAFNAALSAVRVSIEWLFDDVSNYFKFIDFKNILKLQLSAVRKESMAIILDSSTHLSCIFSLTPRTRLCTGLHGPCTYQG